MMCSSSRSRPDEPPSSATDTMAVTRSVYVRTARRVAARPCPPPMATTGAGTVVDVRCPRHRVHRSTSRWNTVVGSSWASSRRDSSSASTTDRCRPPVQPMATVRYDFPSFW